jgi:AcrR family transcriptional regulator
VEERGYGAVTVDDICEAAEVSRSTFFRYFGTKAAVFEADLLADKAWAEFAHETEFSLPRLRELLGTGYRAMDDAEFDQERRRTHLLQSVPELRAGFAQEALRPLNFALEYCSMMLRSDRDDPRVRRLAGAVFGALATIQLPTSEGTIELPADKYEAAAKFEAALDGLMGILVPEALLAHPDGAGTA